jgi:arylsulfatase A-like enzyme
LKKNVLFILADEFRADCLGAAGNPLIQTPNLDALAAEGALIEKCIVQAAPCQPSRMSIMTGRYLCSTGALDNMTPLAEAEDNLAMHLRRHGHAPATMGYNDYAKDPRILPEKHPHRRSLNYDYFLPGFDVLLDHEYDSPEWYAWLMDQGYPPGECNRAVMYSPAVPPEGPGDHLPIHYPAHYRAEHSEAQFMTNIAIDHITRNRGNGWVLNVNYIKPHGPYICPAPYHEMYDPAAVPAPVQREDEFNSDHPYFSRFGSCRRNELRDERDWRELRACYYGMISEVDACIGRLIDALKDSGQWENTLVIFSSDHGSCMGDHYLTGKPHFYDGSLRVPYIIRDPAPDADSTRGKKLDVFTEAIDSAPTICEYLDAPGHPRFQGRSLLGLVRDDAAYQPKERAFFEFYYYNSLKAQEKKQADPEACRLWVVRDDRYKYVQSGEESVPPMLFDLRADPGEFENLVQDPAHAAVVAEYAQHLIRWRIRHEDNRMEQWARQYRW